MLGYYRAAQGARVLRKELHKEVERRMVCTLDKEMTGRPIPDIEALLDGQTAAAELPAV